MTSSSSPSWDVFVSYAHADAEWVSTLVENLSALGVRVFFDAWEIGPGSVITTKLDEGLRRSNNGVLVVSPNSVGRPWVLEEYASLLGRACSSGRLLIPVLYRDAPLPAMLKNRRSIDFRNVDAATYLARVRILAAALKGEPHVRRPAHRKIRPPSPEDLSGSAPNTPSAHELQAHRAHIIAAIETLRLQASAEERPDPAQESALTHLAEGFVVRGLGALASEFGLRSAAKRAARSALTRSQKVRREAEAQSRRSRVREMLQSFDSTLQEHSTGLPWARVDAWRSRLERIGRFQRVATIQRHLLDLIDEIQTELGCDEA